MIGRTGLCFSSGIKAGHTACQWLEPGQLYIVFLEKWGVNADGYRPLDFQERLVDPMTYELLEKTCHLKRQAPLHSTKNQCPNVSRADACPSTQIDRLVAINENVFCFRR